MKKIRIILADDQLLIRAGVRAIIEALPNHELVSECADGHQAIAAIHQFHPDIILLDIAMPGPTGIEVARTVRQFDTNARILVLSSIDRKEIIDQAMHAGADGYLLKDFVLSELLCRAEVLFGLVSATSRRVSSRWISRQQQSKRNSQQAADSPANGDFAPRRLRQDHQGNRPRSLHQSENGGIPPQSPDGTYRCQRCDGPDPICAAKRRSLLSQGTDYSGLLARKTRISAAMQCRQLLSASTIGLQSL